MLLRLLGLGSQLQCLDRRVIWIEHLMVHQILQQLLVKVRVIKHRSRFAASNRLGAASERLGAVDQTPLVSLQGALDLRPGVFEDGAVAVVVELGLVADGCGRRCVYFV